MLCENVLGIRGRDPDRDTLLALDTFSGSDFAVALTLMQDPS
jgi:hypothetical protein